MSKITLSDLIFNSFYYDHDNEDIIDGVVKENKLRLDEDERDELDHIINEVYFLIEKVRDEYPELSASNSDEDTHFVLDILELDGKTIVYPFNDELIPILDKASDKQI